ncbi:MAG: FMN-binding protein [Clostridiales bacterium]|nr:FMN-binding protein [Clostridiales bacterium]
MKKTIIIPLVSIVAVALVLFAAAVGLNGIASENAQADHIYVMQTLLPGSKDFVIEPYAGADASIRSVHKGETGFIIETVTQGYVDEITMLIGVSNEGTVTGLVVRDMHETVGLGANALTDWQFLAQFLKNTGDAAVGTNMDAITGATVTSKAVARCVNSAVAYVTGADVQSGATSWGG